MRSILIIVALAACNGTPAIQPASAQAVGPNGLSRVLSLDAGLCTGRGVASDPLTCAVSVDNATVTGTGSSSSPLAATVDFDGGYFCDGSDGTVTFDGSATILGLAPAANVYTMTRDVCCSGCTINSGVTVQGGWRFFDKGTLTLNGKIARNGSAGSNGTGAVGALGAGAVGVNSWYAAGRGGGNGNTTAAGSIGTACSSGPREICVTGTAAAGANGAACGGGGGGTAGSVGGTGGSVALPAAFISGAHTITSSLTGVVSYVSQAAGIDCGSGGGGGGGVAGAAGGGGGGGGGFTFVGAKRITGSGSVEAIGGNGGNGNAGGNTGGGGGGGGGIVNVLIGFGSFPTTSVSGGNGGTGNGTGANGGNGGSGGVILLRMGN